MKALLILAISLLCWLLVYHDTLFSMMQTWWRSETFAHGFLIFPISLYLIWNKRQAFYSTEKHFSPVFLVILLALVFIWGMAQSVDVLVAQQFAVVLMLPALLGTLFGVKLIKQYLFPSFYLLFAVPFGEFLVPQLQDYTAAMTVWGLQLTGVPVFTEGMFISIPEGDFEVAVACSGIRYLIASLALGTLYAYLTYSRLYKQLLFVLASIIVPVIANGIRAYGIVMIAHLSDMKYATGTDHLIYGWLFFGVVIFILFFIGSFWQDEPFTVDEINTQGHYDAIQSPKALSLALLVLLCGPLLSLWMSYEPPLTTSTLNEPRVSPTWLNKHEKQQKWQPHFKNADAEISTVYENKRNKIEVFFYASEYQYERQDKELVNFANKVFSTKRWLLIAHQSVESMEDIKLDERIVRSEAEKLLIWSWYEVMGIKLTNSISIKIAQALGKLMGFSRGGQFKAVATIFDHDSLQARQHLRQFLHDNPQVFAGDN